MPSDLTKSAVAVSLMMLGVGCGRSGEPSGPVAEPVAPEPTTQPSAAPAAPPPPTVPALPEGAKVFFAAPSDGAEISGAAVDGKVPVQVKMGVDKVKVEPAGPVVEGSGHHHIIVDGEAPPVNIPVAKDETHLHYGKGETEATLQLAPGDHTLTMQFADGLHRSYGPAMSATIKVKVVAAQGAPAADKGAPAADAVEK